MKKEYIRPELEIYELNEKIMVDSTISVPDDVFGDETAPVQEDNL